MHKVLYGKHHVINTLAQHKFLNFTLHVKYTKTELNEYLKLKRAIDTENCNIKRSKPVMVTQASNGPS